MGDLHAFMPWVRNTGCTKVLTMRKQQVGSTLPADPGAACSAEAILA